MLINRLVLQDISALYEAYEWGNSLVVLIVGHPHEWADIQAALRTLRHYASDFTAE